MKMFKWRDDKIRELLSIGDDAKIIRQTHGAARDSGTNSQTGYETAV